MKRFLINLVVFVSLVLVSCALFMGFANGSADAFYSKFTSSKQSSLIIGSSRASQDVRPKIISDVLDGKPIYNYAFTILHSPYGKAYYTSIIKKVDTTKTDGIFILCVNPWTISTLKKHIHDTTFFRENNSFVDNTNWVNLKPNAEYIIESYEQRNIQLLLNRYRKGSFETINVSKDGWLQVTIEENDFNRKKRTQLKMQTYHEHLNNYAGFSNVRWRYLKKTIDYLKQYGQVFTVRLPVNDEMILIEKQLVENFDERMEALSKEFEINYLNFTPMRSNFNYVDGHHLDNVSSAIFSEILTKEIKRLQL
jgi:hypothetical protein